MPSFDASTIVEPLDYDFTKFGGRKAIIPEPSKDQYVKMFAEMDTLVKELAGGLVELPENPSAQDVAIALNQLTMHESYGPLLDGMTQIYSDLCSQTPSVDELSQLPPRIRSLFFQWIGREMRPELKERDSKSVLRPLRIAQNG